MQFDFECDLRDWLFENPHLIEDGLAGVGREVSIAHGRVDLVFKDHADRFLLVELKLKWKKSVIRQLLAYGASFATANNLPSDRIRLMVVVSHAPATFDCRAIPENIEFLCIDHLPSKDEVQVLLPARARPVVEPSLDALLASLVSLKTGKYGLLPRAEAQVARLLLGIEMEHALKCRPFFREISRFHVKQINGSSYWYRAAGAAGWKFVGSVNSGDPRSSLREKIRRFDLERAEKLASLKRAMLKMSGDSVLVDLHKFRFPPSTTLIGAYDIYSAVQEAREAQEKAEEAGG